jgi:hypothetical protein
MKVHKVCHLIGIKDLDQIIECNQTNLLNQQCLKNQVNN